jgi:hypothetical protein
MNARSFFALLLGCIIPATAVFAESSTRLFEIFSLRFIRDDSGQTITELGRFTADGEYKHYIYSQLAAGVSVPAEAMNKNLLPYSIFPAYDVFGTDALANFKLDHSVIVDGQIYFVVSLADQPKLDVGSVLNLSARGNVGTGGDPLTGGFVVGDHPRWVLLRAVGPTLSNFGVNSPLPNPVITLFGSGQAGTLASNDDWSTQSNARDIESAAAKTGAFALPRDSKDAALLVELPPGAYTAQVTSRDASGGNALLEIYIVP